jgi:uncharacterized paraquat-inducible protein A
MISLKCLDCGGKLAFNGQSDFNIHVISERCGARLYYDTAWSLTQYIVTQFSAVILLEEGPIRLLLSYHGQSK